MATNYVEYNSILFKGGTGFVRVFLFLLLISITLILSACSAQQSSPTLASEVELGMGATTGAATPTPGSMIATNPEAVPMMEPIRGANVQPATESKGGQPLAFHEEDGVKVFKLDKSDTQATTSTKARDPIQARAFIKANRNRAPESNAP